MSSTSLFSWSGRFGIATVLVGMTLLATLPILGYALWATSRLTSEREREQLDALQRRAAAVAAAAAREVNQAHDVMAAMRAAYAARHGLGSGRDDDELRDLHRFATELAKTDPHVASISLAAADGRRIFHSGRPWGALLPPSAIADIDAEVIRTGSTLVAPLTMGAVSGEQVIAVAGPLERERGDRLSMRVALRQGALSEAVRSLQLPEPWLATVVDQNGRIVARTRDEALYLAEPVTDDVRVALRDRPVGAFRATTRQNVAVWATLDRVPGTPWSVVVGVPRDHLHELARLPVRRLALGGGLLAALGAVLAFGLGYWLTTQTRQAAAGRGSRTPAVAELHRIHARLREGEAAVTDARHDALTGLPGRGLLLQQAASLQDEIDGGHDQQIAVLFVDLDGFKFINDVHGHAAGDEALKAVAAALRTSVRAGDVAGRWGGDEFVVLLKASPAILVDLAAEVASRIQVGIRSWGKGLDATVGIATWHVGRSLDEAVASADAAMLEGKRSGKGRVVRAA